MEYLIIKDFIEFNCRDIKAYIFKAKAKDILPLYYVAVRGKNNEEGAVQRVLSTKRIGDIAEYVLKGNMFLNTFILNWANQDVEIDIEKEIKIPKIASSMQIIDGQHRLEGIKRAYANDPLCGEMELLIVLTNRLTTKLAAEIFLNINSEQKQVPKSLVYDLFGEIRDPDYHIARARELAIRMNDDIYSPFYQCVKMPGSINKGKIDLSTIVSALKEYLKDSNVFDQYNLTDFEFQYHIIQNYHEVIRDAYGDKWISADNPFLTSAGYFALMKFFCEKLIPLCANKGSFEKTTIQELLNFNNEELLFRDELKNQQGKGQRQYIFNYLIKILTKDLPTSNGYKF